jgi:phenylacetate-CoA ligase
MHVWEDRFVPEVVDPDTGEPLPDGEVGELVLSAPSKEAFPVLRYRTRDRARLIREPCPCGRTSVRVSKILGRTDDMLIVHGVNVFPSQIEDAILGVEGVEPQYRIVLSTRADRQDDLRVQAESRDHLAPPARAALEARLHEVLGSTLGLNVAVELVAPYTIQRSEGKAVRVLDQRAKTP